MNSVNGLLRPTNLHELTETEVLAKEKIKELYLLSRRDTIKFILTAIVLTCGLAWNGFFAGAIEYYYPDIKTGIFPKFIYALGISIFATILTSYVFTGMYSPSFVPAAQDTRASANVR
jgi:hypothetical protein